jgi:hypothetical protein
VSSRFAHAHCAVIAVIIVLVVVVVVIVASCIVAGREGLNRCELVCRARALTYIVIHHLDGESKRVERKVLDRAR